jgi:GNAT superfamily N-acetyltransferase
MIFTLESRHLDTRNYVADESLRDATPFRVRSIRPDDKTWLLDHFSGLSAESRYFRFFGHKRELTNQDLARFTELDFHRHVGIAATLHQNGRERFIGVGRYIRKEAPSRAEIALAVLDQYQRAGIGPLLIRHLARIAHDNGITEFEADVRGDNSRMLAVLTRSGCIINHANGAGIVHFTLKCPELSGSKYNYEFNHAGRRSDGAKGDDHGRFLR